MLRLQVGERVLYEGRPGWRLLAWWAVSKCLPVAFVCGFLSVWGVGFTSGGSMLVSEPGVLIALVVLSYLCSLLYVMCLRRTYSYWVTTQRCVFQGGIVKYVEHSIPLDRITDLERRQTIIERLAGIWAMKILTAASGGSEKGHRSQIIFEGIRDIAAIEGAIAAAKEVQGEIGSIVDQ